MLNEYIQPLRRNGAKIREEALAILSVFPSLELGVIQHLSFNIQHNTSFLGLRKPFIINKRRIGKRFEEFKKVKFLLVGDGYFVL